MTGKREISINTFTSRHPLVAVYETDIPGTKRKLYLAFEDGDLRARVTAASQGRGLYELSERLYRLNSRDAMAEQGWREQGTGSVQPLQAHHIKPRSKGRNDGKENLSGVTARTHAKFHEDRHLTPRPEPE